MTHNVPSTAVQPIRALYLVACLAYCFLVRTPVLAVWYLLTINRPNPSWTWRQAMSTRLVRFLLATATQARIARTFPVVPPTASASNLCVIQPARGRAIQGFLADPAIRPAPMMGEWYPSPYHPSHDAGRKVVLFFFGGGYVLGDWRQSSRKKSCDQLLPSLNAKLLSFAYRLAGSAGGQPFPSQLQDAVSAYQYVLSQGVPAQNIILVGESAGAHLVLALLRYLREMARTLPNPHAALLCSPVTDLTLDLAKLRQSPKDGVDVLPPALLSWCRQTLVPTAGSADHPYISPARHPFPTAVPIWIHVGAEELLLPSTMAFYTAFAGVQGNDVSLYVAENQAHAALWSGPALFGYQIEHAKTALMEWVKARRL